MPAIIGCIRSMAGLDQNRSRVSTSSSLTKRSGSWNSHSRRARMLSRVGTADAWLERLRSSATPGERRLSKPSTCRPAPTQQVQDSTRSGAAWIIQYATQEPSDSPTMWARAMPSVSIKARMWAA